MLEYLNPEDGLWLSFAFFVICLACWLCSIDKKIESRRLDEKTRQAMSDKWHDTW